MEGKAKTKSKKRARKQATDIEVPEYVQASGDYNIWYHKRLGDRPAKRTEPSSSRCDPEKDSGVTKADSSPGRHYICLYFARGKCVNGYKCQYFHRLPSEEDEKSIPITHDIFGRERHATDRDDMGGTGSFNRNNRTLYLGGLSNSRAGLEDIIRKEFGKYGKIEYVRVIPSRLIAFVRYTNRVYAEFAKEAMADQSLSKGEVLNVRWSNEDPNPAAQIYEEFELNRQATLSIMEKTKEKGMPEYMTEGHEVPDAKEHPYVKFHGGKKENQEKSATPTQATDLTSQQDYFLQWAQFFAQQGIDPSQLDEKTIQYYIQYYSSYYYTQNAQEETKTNTKEGKTIETSTA